MGTSREGDLPTRDTHPHDQADIGKPWLRADRNGRASLTLANRSQIVW